MKIIERSELFNFTNPRSPLCTQIPFIYIAFHLSFVVSEKVKKQIEDVIGIDTSHSINCSGKTGEGVEDILESVVKVLPPPKGDVKNPLKSLLVDSWYDSYLGVVILVRVIDGNLKKGMEIKMMSNNSEHTIEKVGVFTPKPKDVDKILSGEIGFIITGIKNLSDTKVGDTICDSSNPIDTPLPGFKPSKPVVFLWFVSS